MEVYDAMVQPPDDSTSGQPLFPVPDPTGNANDVLTTDGANLIWALIKNANVDPAAAIAYSKLALAGQIANSDLVGSIAPTKLVSGADGQVLANHGGAGGNQWLTPVHLGVGVCSGVALSTAFVDMTGMAVAFTTTAVNALWLCIGHFQWSVTTAGTGGSRGQMLLDGVVTPTAVAAATSMDTAAGIDGDTIVSAGTVGPGTHTWKGQSKKQIAAGVVNLNGNSMISVLVVDI